MDDCISRSRWVVFFIAIVGAICGGGVVAATPDWPELDQPPPEDAFAYKLGNVHWSTRAELAERYGGDKLVYVEIVNETELQVKRKVGYVLRKAAPEAQFCHHRDTHVLLGPVNDFESFRRKLTFAEILEQDAAGNYVKIKADPQEYFHRAGGVHLEISNWQELLSDYSFDRDEPWSNFSLSLQLAGQPPDDRWEIRGLKGQAGRYECAPVVDFEKFCTRLTFVDILEKNATTRSLKLRLKPDQLTGDAVLKRIGSTDKLASWEKERLETSDQASSTGDSDERREALRNESPASNPESMLRELVPGSASPVRSAEYGFPTPNDPDYHKKLCDLMLDEANWTLNDKAVDALLLINPPTIPDKAIRKQIAVNFRTLAFREGHPDDVRKAIRGLVLYGGKYSVPVLIDLLEQEQLTASHELLEGLAAFPDAKSTEAVVKELGDFFNHAAAVAAVRKMGPAAEDALMKAAPADDPSVSLTAVQLLGEVGTQKSLGLLARAAASTNPAIVQAARASTKAIRLRTRNAAQ